MKALFLPAEASTRILLLSSLLRNPNPRNGFRSTSLSSSHHSENPNNPFLSVSSSPDRRRHRHRHRHRGGGGGDLGFCSEKDQATSTVALLGWLGAEEKQLKRYAELYSSRGFRPVRETIGPDLCRGVEDRVDALAGQIAAWCAESEDRHLIFHTFSNTGWLTRLSSVISTLKNQPPCPQLYLYSSADKVNPAHAVQCFIQDQKARENMFIPMILKFHLT